MLHLYHISMATSFFFFFLFKLDLWPLTPVHLRGFCFLGSEKSVATGITGTEQLLTSHPDTFEETSENFFFFFPEILKVFFFKLRRGGGDGWIKAIDALSSASTWSGISKLKQPGRNTDTGFFWHSIQRDFRTWSYVFCTPLPVEHPAVLQYERQTDGHVWMNVSELHASPHSCSSSPGCSISTDQSVLLDCQHAASTFSLHHVSIFDCI